MYMTAEAAAPYGKTKYSRYHRRTVKRLADSKQPAIVDFTEADILAVRNAIGYAIFMSHTTHPEWHTAYDKAAAATEALIAADIAEQHDASTAPPAAPLGKAAAKLAELERFATETYSGDTEDERNIARGYAARRMFARLEALDSA